MAQGLPEDTATKRRGCIAVVISAALFLLLLIAISSGWLGHITGAKMSRIITLGGVSQS
jgi:hypothetical protein